MLSPRDLLQRNDPEIFAALAGEEARQASGVEMIPSENYTYPEVLATLGSVFTNKYSEGYPGRRYYGGQEFTDVIERLARERAKQLFRCEHANVQPLSGAPMNAAAYLALLRPGDTVMGMDLSHGGHLTHGAPVSHMGHIFKWVRYKTDPAAAGRIDFDELRRVARAQRPKMIVCGYSSYPRGLRLPAVQGHRRRGRRPDLGRCLPYRRADRGRGARQPVRCGLRHRHHDHAQVDARAARGHDHVPRGVPQGHRSVGLPRPAGGGRT